MVASRARGILSALALAALVALAGEAVLRAFPGLCPAQQQLKIQASQGWHTYVDDPELGARPTPLQRDTVRTLDYEYVSSLDAQGFPNPEPWPDRADVAVLGNSLIVGPGVGLDGQFTSLLDQALTGRRVLNLGLPGGAPEQQLRLYLRYLRPRRPSVVVATLWVASDVDNAVRFEHWLAEGSPPGFTAYRQTFGTTHGGGRALKVVRDLLSESYLLRAVYYGLAGVAGHGGLPQRVAFPDDRTLVLSVRAQRLLAAGARRPGFDLGADLVGPLTRLRAAAEADGARFVVMLLPSKEETYGAGSFAEVLNTVDEARAALGAADLPVLDLYRLFRERGASRPSFFARDIHLNAYGNALVAGALERWLVDEGAFGPSPHPDASDPAHDSPRGGGGG